MHVRGARCTGSAAGVHGRRARRASVRAGARACARGARGCAGRAALARDCARGACAGAQAGARLAHGWHCSPESDDSSPKCTK
ncbi:hypothetical protein CRG98_018338 [Punica granatum]|uniref:Uncharacterized protein n=1 Tax=Punica granatum TaxID=22663 RepID=A0A2I0JY61_PUNGR|nr:hypothetical protein CRG98_018338 [Punica granatum]